MIQDNCEILENRRVAPGHGVIALRSAAIAAAAKPGQFVQILCADSNDPLLPRPFSFLDAERGRISILYHVVGRGTAILERARAGDRLKIVGPLGNGFTLEGGGTRDEGPRRKEEGGRRAVLVGGGVGIPPLYHLAKTLLKRRLRRKEEITVLLGARTKTLLLCEKEFKKLGVNISVATDDGSKGKKGFVTQLLDNLLSAPIPHPPSPFVYTCGPTPMMRAVAALAEKHDVPCEVSVEVPMACGFGACLGCAVPVKDGAGGRRFAVACCEGPVFPGRELEWEP